MWLFELIQSPNYITIDLILPKKKKTVDIFLFFEKRFFKSKLTSIKAFRNLCIFQYDKWIVFLRLEIMFDKAEQRSSELTKSYELLDTWKRRGDDLLYSMLPKTVADRLRTTNSALSTCEVCCLLLKITISSFFSFQAFESVSILFCELVGLTTKTVRETMVIVTTMNNVFSCFDSLVDKYKVYKVCITFF